MSKLRQEMLKEMELRGYSPRTIESYVSHIKRYASYYGKCPSQLGEDEIKDYLHYTIKEQKSASYVNALYSALKFLYETTLQREWNNFKIPRVKQGKKLPVILHEEEVSTLLNSISNIKHKAILMTIYGGGLRVSEVSNLKLIDIDSVSMQIHICQGKGKKDRYSILSKTNLKVLRDYCKLYRPRVWLFEGSKNGEPITSRTIQRVFKKATRDAGIHKDVSVHSLRHSFATHLLNNGTDLAYIQRLLGHSNITTTTVYLHLRKIDILKVKSPLDYLEGNENA